jgi:hypothetical protein
VSGNAKRSDKSEIGTFVLNELFSHNLNAATVANICTKSIVSMNSEACSLMSMGKFRHAGRILVGALSGIQRYQSDQEPTVATIAVISVQLIPIRTKEHECSSFYLYDRALQIDASVGVPTMEQLSAVILYNTGLCYHNMSKNARNEQDSLLKALKMYEMAMSLVDLSRPMGRLIHLASINNKGHIMACFYEHNAAQECLGYLQYLLANASENAEVQRDDIMEIRLNVALLYGERMHAAAA